MDAWVKKSQRRMDYVTKTAAQSVIHEAQLEGPSLTRGAPGKGGNMPKVSGFLASTGRAQIGSMPSGPSQEPGSGSFAWDQGATELVILNSQPGDVIFFGWTAAYARAMEDKYGFMRSAAAKWQGFVEDATREARARIR